MKCVTLLRFWFYLKKHTCECTLETSKWHLSTNWAMFGILMQSGTCRTQRLTHCSLIMNSFYFYEEKIYINCVSYLCGEKEVNRQRGIFLNFCLNIFQRLGYLTLTLTLTQTFAGTAQPSHSVISALLLLPLSWVTMVTLTSSISRTHSENFTPDSTQQICRFTSSCASAIFFPVKSRNTHLH